MEDIDQALEELKAKGVPLIDQQARPGAHQTRVAFLHPKGTNGILIELVRGDIKSCEFGSSEKLEAIPNQAHHFDQ